MHHTYVNPLCLPEMPVLKCKNHQKNEEKQGDPFAVGKMICEHLPATHERFKPVFRGMLPYLGENDTRATADPAGFYYQNEWYIYSSNGALWHSKDFENWDFTDVGYVYEYAPGITVSKNADGTDRFYLAGNSTHLFAADDPKGPFEDIGAFTWQGQPIEPQNNDVALFTDDDGQMYLYWGMGPGIYGAKLSADHPNELASAPVELIRFNPENTYERMGQHNQNWENGFPEGAWMLKYKGVYYLIWATAGTQYDSYCMGAYKSQEGPLTGFEIQKRPAALNENGRLLRGAGHGSIVEGPDETLWCFYTVNIGLENDMERRIACEPVAVDENGDIYVPMFCDEPQYVPGYKKNPSVNNRTGEVVLTARQVHMATSHVAGYPPVYALDENMMTCWQPEEDDKQPSLLVSLQGNYNIAASRVMFKEIGLDVEQGSRKSTFKYKIEVMDSADEQWKILIDCTSNEDDFIMDYQRVTEPVRGQFVRLTLTGWNENIRPAVVEFTCFGTSERYVEKH